MFEFREAERSAVGLLVGLAGGTGSGKTYTAMRLAKGICGSRKFAVVDSEAGRAKHYADFFKFDHGDLTPPFTPDRYLEAILAADHAGYPAIVVDNLSHEHAGEGGLLEWHDAEVARLSKGDAEKAERVNLMAWIEPKMAHKRMVQRLLQVRAHLILCFRAEAKIEVVKEGGKTVYREKQSLVGYNGWIPIAEKTLPYELTVSFMLLAQDPGVPHPIKLQEQHKHLFPGDRPIDEACGANLAAWAAGAPVNWPDRIMQCSTVSELYDVGRQLNAIASTLTHEALVIARAQYKSKLEEFQTTKREAGVR